MEKIIPCLWFDNQGEEAVRFYASIFKSAKLGRITRYGTDGPGPAGSVLTIEFQLEGRDFLVLNGGPEFKFTEAVSLVVSCQTQAEVDNYWKKLTADGGQEVQCGWLKDKYGLSWQIVPEVLYEMLADEDTAKVTRVMQAIHQMIKLDIKQLKAAYAGK